MKMLQRIWREICTPPVRRAYTLLLITLAIRLCVHTLYVFLMGRAIERLPNAADPQALTLLFVPALLMLLVEYALDWRVRLAADAGIASFPVACNRLIDQKFFGKSIGQHLGSGEFTQGAMLRGKSELLGLNQLFVYGGLEFVLLGIVSFGSLWFFCAKQAALLTIVFGLSMGWANYMNSWAYQEHTRILLIHERPTNRRREDLWDAVARVIFSGRAADSVLELASMTSLVHGQYQELYRIYQKGMLARDAFNWLGYSSVLLWAAYDLWSQGINLGLFLVISGSSLAALANVRYLSRVERSLYSAMPAIDQLFELLDLPPEVIDIEQPAQVPARPFTIDFRNVGVRLSGRTILQNITLSIKPGERVAVIGASGTGKTTLARLLQRAMLPTSGRIVIDGERDLSDFSRDSWYGRVAFIDQDPKVIDGTIEDNILFGLPPHERGYWTEARLWEMVNNFQVNFIDDLKARVGRQGLRLSGGEKQRLLILAAAIKAPQLLIIDEATSALDGENQVMVQEALDELVARTGAAAVIIAHRLSTIRRCTKFVVLRPPSDHEPQIETIASSLLELQVRSEIYKRFLALENGEQLPTSKVTGA